MRVGVVGCGHMASVMVSRWLDLGLLQAEQLSAATATELEAAAVRERLGIACSARAADAIVGCDLVLLAIKPQQVNAVLPAVAAHVPPGQIWLSVLAGTLQERIAALLDHRPRVVRVMPNTPAAVGLGATAVCLHDRLQPEERDLILQLLAGLGEVFPMDEAQLNGFIAVAGSGPAYLFLMLESLQAYAKEQGFDGESARRMAVQMVRGAAALADQDGGDPGRLRRLVTSRGGTTEAAIGVLMARQWPEILTDAMTAAAKRGAELAGQTP